ncbi:hypothetical protein C8R45DRAFT_979014 [Mycena sanguinolenta]|nr:hypothetical protein C8R45DRAFT_979014 [Mycena sanguinolenta]
MYTQQGEYPEYATHSSQSTSREDSNHQWEPQESLQHPSSDHVAQQAFEQTLNRPRQNTQPLSRPPPPAQQAPQLPIEDPRHLVPSQIPAPGTHDPTLIRLFPAGGQPVRSPPVEIQPIMLRSTASASRTHNRHNPYQRPSSASGRREVEVHHHVRFASQANTPQGTAVHSPTATRQTFASPLNEFRPPQQSSSPSFASTSFEDAFAPFVLPQEAPAPSERRYLIRADTYYDPNTRVLTALLELPGVKKPDLRITLATTLFNRVRQVTVNGHSRPPLSSSPTLRERKYGRFARAFPVPADTKVRFAPRRPVISDPFCFRVRTNVLTPVLHCQPDDIDAAMEDGVLVLKIACGLPAPSADEHEIPIR